MVGSIGDCVTLNDGHAMPVMGLGTDKIADASSVADIIGWATEAGYRHVDTATWYGNERFIGDALRACGIPREQFFITTKLNNPDQGYDSAIAACERSLAWLGLDYVDLYLIHWPGPDEKNAQRRLESYQALVELKRMGKVRSIGVSNFQPRHIEHVIEATGVIPAVNQIERHPWLNQGTLIAYLKKRGICAAAWAPLMRGRITEVPLLHALAEKYGKSPAQITLRWHWQSGVAMVPKTQNRGRLRENVDIFDFVLSEEDMAAVDVLDRDFRLRYHPDTMDVGFPGDNG